MKILVIICIVFLITKPTGAAVTCSYGTLTGSLETVFMAAETSCSTESDPLQCQCQITYPIFVAVQDGPPDRQGKEATRDSLSFKFK